jgi:hypothetical protein
LGRKWLYSIRRMQSLRTTLRQLLFAVFAIDLALVVPLHSTLATIEAHGGSYRIFLDEAPGYTGPAAPSKPGQPLPHHDEATCALCAVAGHILIAQTAIVPLDGTIVATVEPFDESKDSNRTVVPLPSRAPPAA